MFEKLSEIFIRLLESSRVYIVVIAALVALVAYYFYDESIAFAGIIFCAVFLGVSFLCYLWYLLKAVVHKLSYRSAQKKEERYAANQLVAYVEDVYTMLSERDRYILYYAIIVGEPAKESSCKFLAKHCTMAHMIRRLDTVLNKENKTLFRVDDPYSMSMDVVYYIHRHLIELAKHDIEENKLSQKKIESYFFKSPKKRAEQITPVDGRNFQVLL